MSDQIQTEFKFNVNLTPFKLSLLALALGIMNKVSPPPKEEAIVDDDYDEDE